MNISEIEAEAESKFKWISFTLVISYIYLKIIE